MNVSHRRELPRWTAVVALAAWLSACNPLFLAGEEPPVAPAPDTTVAPAAPGGVEVLPARPAPRRPELRPLTGCGFDQRGPVQSLFVAATGKELVLTGTDGAARVIHTFAAGHSVEVESFWIQKVLAGRELIFAMAAWRTGRDPAARGEQVLLDREGRLLWRGETSSGWFYDAFLGEGGVAIHGSPRSLVVSRGGVVRELPSMTPLTGPRADGTLAVTIDTTVYAYGKAAFLKLGEATATPVSHAVRDGLPRAVGERLVYLTTIDGGPFLVSEGPGGDVRKVALPSATLGLYFIEAGGRFAILSDHSERAGIYRADLVSLAVEQVEVNLPAGLRRFNVGWYTPSTVGADGSLMMGLRDDYAGRLYRSTDLGRTWSVVGGSTVDVLDILGVSRGGTFLVHGTNNRYSYETWKAPPDGAVPDVVGVALQVVRPGSPTRFVVPETRYLEMPSVAALSADGLCLGYWQHANPDGGATGPATLKLLDVEKGVTRSVFSSAMSRQEWGVDDVVWIPR